MDDFERKIYREVAALEDRLRQIDETYGQDENQKEKKKEKERARKVHNVRLNWVRESKEAKEEEHEKVCCC